ncbi:hypothetical protein AQUSIP_02190 [Aquicella siphonis]|uniref:Uncharacterized protein n=1 Tax=Aquicella siphonis TaxID=254247 RepID=A0A5E4PEB9_9COXI|nr:hypothetical protein AQUSIP_02190 [Aquicella siphonis]
MDACKGKSGAGHLAGRPALERLIQFDAVNLSVNEENHITDAH